jgi:hypothetical protein
MMSGSPGCGSEKPAVFGSSGGCNVCKVFVTSPVPNGDFGGVAGADALCMDPAYGYPGVGTYKALIVDGVDRVASVSAAAGDGQVDWVLHRNARYYRSDGVTRIANSNSSRLFDFPLLAGVDDTTNGYWNGLEYDWTTATDNCVGWTSAMPGDKGRYGDEGGTGTIFVHWGDATCDVSAATLVCVEQ